MQFPIIGYPCGTAVVNQAFHQSAYMYFISFSVPLIPGSCTSPRAGLRRA
ncbi:hypothetical protein SNL152K_4477 [Streptomyces sp. NL15-2K]|nr:hypothetical protein SNL152K_4477 [Streptomyces sp. NL15-2K]